MAKTKKGFIYFLVSMIFMLTGLFFVACGEGDRYANVNLKPSNQSVSLFVGEKTEIYFEIENYTSDMDNTLNFTIETSSNDSSDKTLSGEHISVEVLSRNNERVRVEITALSSGQSTLVASMREGYKQCSVNVNVKQYSQSFNVDSEKVMYITLGSDLYPDKDYFVFDEGATEKDVKFYRAITESDISAGNEFTHIDFTEIGEQKTIRFLDNNNAIVDSQNCTVDGENFSFFVQYTYMEKGEDGLDVPVTITRQTSIIAIFGINEDAIQIYQGIDDEGVLTGLIDKNNFSIDFIIRPTKENQIKYYITAPIIQNLSINMLLKYEFIIDGSVVGVTKEDVTEIYKEKNNLENLNLKLFEITLASSTIKASRCDLLVQVYYAFENGQSFRDENNFNVNCGLTIPINVRLMPEKLEIVDENENLVTGSKISQDNPEIYYNYYAGTNYGWEEYKLNVYKTTSEYSGVKVEFDFSKVIIQYRGKIYNSTESFIIDDISKPFFVKGVDGTTAPIEDDITFSVQSELFGEDEEIVARLHYKITEGASAILFKTNKFRTDGIYLKIAEKSNVFADLYTEKDFKSFSITSNKSGVVLYSELNKELVEDKYVLSFNLSPLRVEEDTLTVRLDNGVSTTVTVRVINSFEDLTISLKDSPQAVSFEEKTEGSFELVLKNVISADKTSVIYGQRATFVLVTSYENSILNSSLTFDEGAGVASLLGQSTVLEKILETSNKGWTDITISATGVGVENFERTFNVVKEVKVTLISFVPVSTIKTYDGNTSTEINSAVVYAQATESSKTTANIRVSTTPLDAYYFFNVDENSYETGNIENYIYWTLSDGVYAYPASDTTKRKSLITGREAYYISGKAIFSENDNYGIFQYDNSGYYKFTVNRRYLQGATFTIYASIRQYGLKKYAPVTIDCRQFVAVSEIYTTNEVTEYSFKNASEKLEFTTYLNPYEATVTGIKCFYVHTSGDERLLEENIDLTEDDGVVITTLKTTTSRAYMISVQLSRDVVDLLTNVTDTVAGILYVAPLDWCNSTGQGLEGVNVERRSRVIKINLSFQNGTYENPYVLKTFDDVLAIGSSEINKQSNYIVYDMIDMSKAKTKDFPICEEFSGTIRGARENSGFRNINITNFGGMFGKILKNDKNYSLENLNFEGSININSTSSGTVGLVAEVCEGNVVNISVKLSEASSLYATDDAQVYAGIMFGRLNGKVIQDFTRNYISVGGRYYGGNGNIIKVGVTSYNIVNGQVEIEGTKYDVFNVVKTPVFADKDFNITAQRVFAGAIAGTLNGEVTKVNNSNLTYYNYASYTVFAKINVNSGELDVALGGIAGIFEQGTISGVVIGGEYYYALAPNNSDSVYVGGVFGRTESKTIEFKDLTTRAFVRGYQVGAIAGSITSNNSTASNLKVQAIDDGVREGISASMVTRLTNNSSPVKTETKYQICYDGNLDINVVTIATYITRDKYEVNNTSTTENRSIDEYYGDFIIIQMTGDNVGTIIYQDFFTTQSAGGMIVSIDSQKKFNGSDPINATYALYFRANAYYEDGKSMSSNLIEKQELLNSVLNTISSSNYPFTISNGESVSVSSKSPNITVTSNGNIVLSGPGLAEVDVSSLLNRREAVKIYLYVVNYFDVEPYLKGLTQDLFFDNTYAFVDNTQFSVITNRVLNIAIKAKMNSVLDANDNINVDDKGILKINNFAIELASANPYIEFDVEFKNVGDIYGQATKYADGFFFSKKTDAQTDKDSHDDMEITAYLSFYIGDAQYKLQLVKLKNIRANYYEGATEILTDYSSYSVITGEKSYDYLTFVSDVVEWGEVGSEVEPVIDVLDEKGIPTNLFLINAFRLGDGNDFRISIEVNKDSVAYKSRFTENIYGTYDLIYYSTSHGKDGISKLIKIYFEEQNVNTIDLASINNLAGYLDFEYETVNEYVVPNQQGILQVAVLPTDADFDFISIENTDVNYQAGSTSASFVVGCINEIDNAGNRLRTFETISGAVLTQRGIRISKDKLETSKQFKDNGEFFVRYVFGSSGAINESPEQIKVSAYNFDSNTAVCTNVIDLKLNTKYALGLKLNGKENKDYVARGLSYDLEVINAGYDATEVQVFIPTEYENYASITTDEDGNYQLHIANEVEGGEYYQGSDDFAEVKVAVSVKRMNADGQVKEETADIELRIIEYVVNYKYSNNIYEDLISGMSDGVVPVVVGEKTTLSVDFDNWDMIEYNPDNNITASIKGFLKDLTENGTWVSYIDRNDNGVKTYPSPIEDKNQAYRQTFGKDKKFTNYYYKVDGTTFTTKVTLNPTEKHALLTYFGNYHIENGLYKVGFANKFGAVNFNIGTEFTLRSYVRGSDENPIPIYSYNDLKEYSANQNASYRLMNDVVITSEEFEPLQTVIASLDGNGYKFIFSNFTEKNDNNLSSEYDLTGLSEIGLFSSVSENTVLKNITIQIGNEYSGNVNFNTSSSASLVIGLLAANNDGVITNSRVFLYGDVKFFVNGNSSSASYIGGLVGVNSGSGFITHCQSEISMTASFNMGGLVGTNSGHIASSFFKGGKITNNVSFSTTGINSAGFAVVNHGKIVSSYTSSTREDINFTDNDPWQRLNNNYDITSSVQSAGFVFKNGENGEISNCYSKLSLSQNNNMAGFVFVNDGLCRNDISFSLVNPAANSNYGFASGESIGNFKNCYYLRDTTKTINNAQNFTYIDGVVDLTISKCNLLNSDERENNFTTYNYYIEQNDNYIWNYSEEKGRLELVDANIIAFSQKVLADSDTRYDENGQIIYDYETADTADDDGLRTNPFVISNPEKFENYISKGETLNKYFRIVCELDYSNYASNFSTSFRKNFQGYIFGNEMEITNINLYSQDSLEQAGLFGKISGNSAVYACVKDLTIKPTQVSFVNAREVGTLAGYVSYADISNIKVYGTPTNEDPEEDSDDDFSVVMGNNMVGGVIGYAANTYNISNIEAKISTMAQTITLDDDYLVPTSNESSYLKYNLNKLSFSGGVVGFLGGNGQIKNVTVRYSNIVSMGSEASFVFGFVGKQAVAKNIEVNVHKSMLIRAFVYGGIVAGGCYGTLENVVVNGTGTTLNLFSGIPYYPKSIGGVAGYASGAEMTNLRMSQSISMPYQDNLVTRYVEFVGGVVGKLISDNSAETTISNVIVDGSVYAADVLGGIVGYIDRSSSLRLNSAGIKEVDLQVKGRIENPVLGNFVGQCEGVLLIENAYSYATLIVNIYTYEVNMTASIGEIVGKTGLKNEPQINNSRLRVAKNIYAKNVFDIYMADKSAVKAGTEYPLSNDKDDVEAYKKLLDSLGYNYNNDGTISGYSSANIFVGTNLKSAGIPTNYYSRWKDSSSDDTNKFYYYRMDVLENPVLAVDPQDILNKFAGDSNIDQNIWSIRKDLYGDVFAYLEFKFERNL